MKKKSLFLIILILITINGMSQYPVIIMTTSNAVGSAINLEMQANADSTPIQIDFGDGILKDFTVNHTWTYTNGVLAGTQTVKIYGAGIKWLKCSSNSLITLDVTNYSSLINLDCYDNNLTILDVTQNTELESLFCGNNQLTMIDVSKNTELNYLLCENNQLTSIDVTKNSKLYSLSFQDNQVTSIDVTNNTELIGIVSSNNPLTVIDVTKNIKLSNFTCVNNNLTSLDVSKNPKLSLFFCNNNQLTELDLSNDTSLTIINCSNNLLSSLDLSKAKTLYGISFANNRLTTLDISQNPLLNKLDCSDNLLTFDILPLISDREWEFYEYSPQKPIIIAKTLQTGIEFDLSSQLTINGKTTVYVWKTQSGSSLIEGADYTITDGKTVFLKAIEDSVYCQMTNSSFPDFKGSDALKTICTKVITGSGTTDIIAGELEIYTQYKRLFINFPYKAHLSIYDINGRLLVSKYIDNGTNTIELPNNGIYLLKLTNDMGSVTRKILIR